MDMDHRRNLDTTRVTKEKLVAQLENNLEVHRADFAEAHAGFADEVLDLAGEIASAKMERDYELVRKLAEKLYRLPEPKSHEQDYVRALARLEASEDEEFVLDEATFNQFWFDDWAWKQHFSSTTSNYKGR